MIVAMQKVTVFLSASNRDAALRRLRQLGILHVKPTVPVAGDSLIQLENQISAVERALHQIDISRTDSGATSPEPVDPGQLVTEILNLAEKKTKLAGELEKDREKQNWYRVWGRTCQAELAQLASHGVFVHLYSIDKAQQKRLPADKLILCLKEDKNRILIALLAGSKDELLDLKEEAVPAEDFLTVSDRIAAAEKEITGIDERLLQLVDYQPILKRHLVDLQRQHRFVSVRAGMGVAEDIVFIEGYCPTDTLEQFKKAAEQEAWGYITEDPSEPDDVPTLLRRPRWLNMVEPIFNFMGTLPGYHEYDISFWFLCFFSLFFAILVGDAGYGLVFLIGTLLFRRKHRQAAREPFILMYVLSGALIVWGAITGMWFGQETIARLPLFDRLIIDRIYSFSKKPDEVTRFLMYFTFLIGALHLTVGHLLNGMKKINSLQALAQVGWIGVVWGMFFLAGRLVLSNPLPSVTLYLIGGGALLIGSFDNYLKGHFWKGVGATVGNLPLSIIGSFGDVVSYLRLFAVGLAGSVVEVSFNNMALGGEGGLVKVIVAGLILIFGHGLNMILCLMSVIVHGIRLNMLEFSGHLGMQWTGKKYLPFREE